MPWSQTTPMHQRTLFIADHLRGLRSVTELCTEYGISRKTGYKWIDRYIRRGPAGLEDRSRRPRRAPNATATGVVNALVELRHRHPTWGAKKLLAFLARRHPDWNLPGRSATCALLKRRGLVLRKTPRRAIGHPGKPSPLILAPNHVWCADFKGQFRMGNGRYCYPLTVTDGHSRFLLGCQGLTSTAVAGAKPVFSRLFHEHGLPQYIRTDNGVPFATNTLARLSRLSAWWVRLGVLPQLIEPGKPQQNGRHERMHRTLKAETTRPPAASLRSHQSSSITSARSSTTSDLTRRWSRELRPAPTKPHHGQCRASSQRSNTRIDTSSATSAPTAASAGTTAGSTSRPPASVSTLDWKRSMTESGMCISVRSSSADCWSAR